MVGWEINFWHFVVGVYRAKNVDFDRWSPSTLRSGTFHFLNKWQRPDQLNQLEFPISLWKLDRIHFWDCKTPSNASSIRWSTLHFGRMLSNPIKNWGSSFQDAWVTVFHQTCLCSNIRKIVSWTKHKSSISCKGVALTVENVSKYQKPIIYQPACVVSTIRSIYLSQIRIQPATSVSWGQTRDGSLSVEGLSVEDGQLRTSKICWLTNHQLSKCRTSWTITVLSSFWVGRALSSARKFGGVYFLLRHISTKVSQAVRWLHKLRTAYDLAQSMRGGLQMAYRSRKGIQ